MCSGLLQTAPPAHIRFSLDLNIQRIDKFCPNETHRLKSPPCIQKENLQVMRNLGPKMHEISKLGGDFSTPNDAEREGKMWISKIC